MEKIRMRASAAVQQSSGPTVQQWWAGADPVGHLVAKIAVPTLLADGTNDRLDPMANAHLLQRLIQGTKLVLYPDAGHAFWFQDNAAFASVIKSSLGGGKSN